MRKIVFFLAIVAFIQPSLKAQRVEDALQKLYKDYPQEKVILSLSKNDYVAGETIFFKGYVLTGYIPSEISTNLYVELYDRNKKMITKDILPVYKGSTEGSIALPASLSEDVYFIHAYTHWMLNFDEGLHYLQPVKIYNPFSSNKLTPKPVQWAAAVFPESNVLLDGIASRVSIRLFAQGSLPEKWQATLFEKNNQNPVTTIESFNREIGILNFIPSAGVDYFVRITDNASNTKDVSLPQAQKEGIALQVRNENNKLAYQVTFKTSATKGEGYKIVGTINDEKVFSAVVKKSKGIVSGTIDTKDLPSGILHFSLFDDKENLVAERLCFIEPLHLKFKELQIVFDTLSTVAKAANHWHIDQDTLTWFTYSVQVQDANYPRPTNFLSSLYLTSDFFDGIDDPSWYFDDMDANKAAALDALLITEKWKRFSWSDLLQNKFPTVHFLPDKYLSFKATVARRKKMEPIKDVNLIFHGKDSSMQFVQATIDTAGHFYLDDVMFTDTVKVYFQLNSKKYAAKDISIDFQPLNTFAPLTGSLPAVPFTLSPRNKTESLPPHLARAEETKNSEQLINEKFKMMQEVVIRYNRRSATDELDKKLSSGLFQTDNAMVFDFINTDQTSALGYSNIIEWLQGRVPGLYVTSNNGIPTPRIRGGSVEIFVDEMKTDAEYLQSLPINDIAMVKVIRGMFLGSTGNGSAIAIYTKRGDIRSKYGFPSLPSNTLIGYKKQPVFFSPDYSIDLYKDFTDKREILFHKSSLVPDLTNSGVIRFNNNDVTKTYRVLVTGFTSDGTPVYLDRLVEEKKL